VVTDLPTEDRQAGPVPVVTGGGITGWHNVAQAKGPGIVTGRYGTIGEFYLVEHDYWPLNTSLYSIDLHGNHAGFLRYMLEPLAPLFHLNAAKSAVPGIDRSDIHTIPVAVPPLATQHTIAAYLDRETARLDGLVVAKERVLGLVAEKRRALITRAVTRGLDPCVPLRDSGIPWLGEIPAHWELIPLRFLVDIVGGATPDTGKAEFWDGDIPWVSPKDMKRNEIKDTEDHVSALALSSSALRLIDPVVVLIVVRGMILAHSFPTAITTQSITINQDMKALCCRELLEPHYLRDFLRGLELQIVSIAGESAHGTRKLESEVLGRFQVCVPPMDEQRIIVAHIAAETAKLDNLQAATERTIALLKERRAALIAATVTGQIEVEGSA
jgi:type I restriction enzyme S subunit